MYSILDHLFISSAEVASQENVLLESGIKSIVSIGCDTDNQFPAVEYLSFPRVLDTPETNILTIIERTNAFIQSALDAGDNVLVHCVYGQSRSATVIVSYLLHTGMTLPDAMRLMKRKNPTTCINPGFLAQLCFLVLSGSDSLERRYFELSCIVDGNRKTVEGADTIGLKRGLEDITRTNDLKHDNTVICRSCKTELVVSSDTLSESCGTAAFVKKHEDGFWTGYRPNRSKALAPPVVLPDKSMIAVYPSEWMLMQVHRHRALCGLGDKCVPVEKTYAPVAGKTEPPLDGNECELHCPTCTNPVGVWRSKSLNLLGECNLCDLFALKTDLVRVKKFRNVPNL